MAAVPQDFDSIHGLVAAYLVETDVAVFMTIGSEKMRYLVGYAVAVNARGEQREVQLDDIDAKADEIATIGTPVTSAAY